MIKLYHNDEFYGVRTAIYSLKSKDGKPDIILCPITFFGREEYYQEVFDRLRRCDVVAAVVKNLSSSKGWSVGRVFSAICGLRKYGLIRFDRKKYSDEMAGKWVYVDPVSGSLKKPIWVLLLYAFFSIYKLWSVIFRGRNYYRNHIVMPSIRSNINIRNDEKTRKLEKYDAGEIPGFMLNFWMRVSDHAADGVSSIFGQLEDVINGCDDGVVGVLGVGTNIKIALMCLTEVHGYKVIGSEWVGEPVMLPD